ncbi:hypothetical protein [Ferrimonas gelatinilytica]|uniref:Major facilitator superfamily (MFS) profile domain-containing protein n=1 Tax=Ferrimonas gelatinilytica TaxID=1255257 RepID=A0ABP9RUG9_9GAMM
MKNVNKAFDVLRIVFIILSPIPAVMFSCLYLLVQSAEGFGAFGVAQVLLVPTTLSVAMTLAGVIVAFWAKYLGERLIELVLTTLLSSSVLIFIFIIKVVL